jgi:hypothetical protein
MLTDGGGEAIAVVASASWITGDVKLAGTGTKIAAVSFVPFDAEAIDVIIEGLFAINGSNG